MKKTRGITIGLLFILVGLLYAGSALDLFEFSIFFPGWWTLFIIVPCFYALKLELSVGAYKCKNCGSRAGEKSCF